MMRPRLLDLFCGAGGAAMGYHRAGFDVVGVDIKPQPHYPFEFHLGDALEYCAEHGQEFDVIHASPPCQHYTWSAARWHKNHPDLVDATRAELQKTGKPFVIENVIGAPTKTVIRLCGMMFGLELIRHRNFETSLLCFQPYHRRHLPDFATVAGHGGERPSKFSYWQKAMGIDWMDKYELTQAIPPAYTEFIGKQIMRALEGVIG